MLRCCSILVAVTFLLACCGCSGDNPPPPATPVAHRPPATPTIGPDAVRAEPGVGAQGKGYGNGDAGLITTPISTYFTIRERIAFMQLDKAMNDFKTLNGHPPRSQKEFDKEIMQQNALKLPELPPGSKYVYDPKQGELMVVHPKKK